MLSEFMPSIADILETRETSFSSCILHFAIKMFEAITVLINVWAINIK